MTNTVDDSTLDDIKSALMAEVVGLVGVHMPEEGTEDQAEWKSSKAWVESLVTFADIVEYLESNGRDVDEFLMEFNLD